MVQALPADAAHALAAWRKARDADALPHLEFAASEIPPRLLPMSMCYRRMPDGTYLYSLVGDELADLLIENPKGTTVLHSAPDAERRSRYAIIDRAIDAGAPFWFATRSTLTDGSRVEVGRLALPARNGDRKVLLVMYFMPDDPVPEGVKFASLAHWDESQIAWLDAGAAPDARS